MPFCRQCGAEEAPNSSFCNKCGSAASLKGEPQPISVILRRPMQSSDSWMKKPFIWIAILIIGVLADMSLSTLNSAFSQNCDQVSLDLRYSTLMNGGWAYCYSTISGTFESALGQSLISGVEFKTILGLIILICLGGSYWIYRFAKKHPRT